MACSFGCSFLSRSNKKSVLTDALTIVYVREQGLSLSLISIGMGDVTE